MERTQRVSMTVNGEAVSREIPVRLSLADFLRGELDLKGTHVGCEQGVCGACTVRLDGYIVRSCLLFAVQAEGAAVETIEGLTASGELAALQKAFHELNALQCGFCTPGMLLTAADLLRRRPAPSREEIRRHIGGNYCRCTGYQSIVEAIEVAAGGPRDARGPPWTT
jgi:aerobic carbon-monoxide dehydrogenase small subunit